MSEVETQHSMSFIIKPALQTGSVRFCGRQSVIKDATELHYRKCRIPLLNSCISEACNDVTILFFLKSILFSLKILACLVN